MDIVFCFFMVIIVLIRSVSCNMNIIANIEKKNEKTVFPFLYL